MRVALWMSAWWIAVGLFAPPALGQDLQECLRLGLERSDQLAAARAQVEAVRQEKNALTPSYFPQIGVDARALWVKPHSTVPTMDLGASGAGLSPELAGLLVGLSDSFGSFMAVPDRNLDLTVQAYQPLTQLAQVAYYQKALGDGEKVAALGRDLAHDRIALGIGATYFNVLLADRQIEALARAQKQVDRLLEDAGKMLEQGMIIKADLLKMEIRRRDLDVSVLRATSARDLARSSLAQAIGLPPDRVLVADIDVPLTPLRDLAWHVEQGRANRRELRMGSLQESMAANQAKAAWFSLLPQVGAIAQANFNDDNILTTPDRTYMAGGMLSFNLFGMGADILKARAADSRRSKAAAEAASVRDEVDLSIEKAWRDAIVARSVVDAAKRTIEQAAESFRAETDRYKAGKSTTSELLGAQTQLTMAETGYQSALYGVALADAALNVAIGVVPFPGLM